MNPYLLWLSPSRHICQLRRKVIFVQSERWKYREFNDGRRPRTGNNFLFSRVITTLCSTRHHILFFIFNCTCCIHVKGIWRVFHACFCRQITQFRHGRGVQVSVSQMYKYVLSVWLGRKGEIWQLNGFIWHRADLKEWHDWTFVELKVRLHSARYCGVMSRRDWCWKWVTKKSTGLF